MLVVALGHAGAGLLQQALEMDRPTVTIRLDDKGQLPQEMRPAQAMTAVLIGQIGGPAVMDDGPPIARDDVDGRPRVRIVVASNFQKL